MGGGSASDPAGRRILVISPVHNEARYLPATVASMTAQTLRPALWLLVDDGSTDETGALADAAAAAHPDWIRVLHRPRRTTRSVGPGVVAAFGAGLAAADLAGYDYLCKLDGDLRFGPGLFAGLVRRMEADPRLGTVSGKIAEERPGGRLVPLRTGDDFSLGMCKFFRRLAFEEIGGFVPEVMWDGIDCHRCRMLGWRAASVADPEIGLVHLRPMGSSYRGIFHGRRRWGRGQWFMGTHPLYLLAITFYRMAERPWALGGLNILAGYLLAAAARAPRYGDREFGRFLRAWQLRRLGLGLLAGGGGRRDDGRGSVAILGVTVERVTMEETLARIEAMIRSGRPHLVLTPNVDHIMRCRRDPALARAYAEGDLRVADGHPVVWASRLLGRPLPERVAGSDLTPRLAALAAARGFRVYLLGGLPGAAEGAARVLQARHPGLEVAGWECPPLGFDRDPAADAAVVARVRAAAPHILFVALGSPKQELWLHRHRAELAVPVAIGVGASLDFLAGLVRRAPRAVQRAGLEWLWRLLAEPRRLWRRYLVDDLPFPALVLAQWWRERARRRSEPG